MKEINDKEMEQAAGGFMYRDYPVAALELLGYTKHGWEDGTSCSMFDPVLKTSPSSCGSCNNAMVSSEDTKFIYCTKKMK